MPARATASRTASAPRSVAGMSFSVPRNLPVGMRTALTMTASCMTAVSTLYEARQARAAWPTRGASGDFDLRDHARPEPRLELADEVMTQAMHFLRPLRILRLHLQHAAFGQRHLGDARDRGAAGGAPREGDLLRA